jgi:hypothetical protein
MGSRRNHILLEVASRNKSIFFCQLEWAKTMGICILPLNTNKGARAKKRFS